ncbi:MAG: 30S ribosomal protein S6 [bacterium]
MTKYEIMFITKTTMEDDALKKVAEDTKNLISGDNSKVIEFKELGKKKLAYPIKKEVSGAYYLMIVEATNDVIKEFDRKCLINENLLRHLVLKVEGE